MTIIEQNSKKIIHTLEHVWMLPKSTIEKLLETKTVEGIYISDKVLDTVPGVISTHSDRLFTAIIIDSDGDYLEGVKVTMQGGLTTYQLLGDGDTEIINKVTSIPTSDELSGDSQIELARKNKLFICLVNNKSVLITVCSLDKYTNVLNIGDAAVFEELYSKYQSEQITSSCLELKLAKEIITMVDGVPEEDTTLPN